MSAEHRICWVLVCDACRGELEYPDEDYTPHFDTVDAATDHAQTLDPGDHRSMVCWGAARSLHDLANGLEQALLLDPAV